MINYARSAALILNKIHYITIATSSRDGRPWNTPLGYTLDENLNFYWISEYSKQHSKNIQMNSNIFIVIYDSTVPEQKGEAVYIEAFAQELDDPKEIRLARTLFKGSDEDAIEKLSGKSLRRAYRATPQRVWINGSKDNHPDTWRDTRFEIDIAKLKQVLAHSLNPKNDALTRTYFVGGPPRVGKTLLAHALASKVQGHVTSTDAIRNSIKEMTIESSSPLFCVERLERLPDADWIDTYKNNPHHVINLHIKESSSYWNAIIAYADSFCEDDAIHIVEGVAVVPKLVHEMKDRPEHIVFVGNTSTNHFMSMIDYAKAHPHKDWMAQLGYSDQKIQAMAIMIQKMSEYFRDEAKKYGYTYYDLSDSSVDAIVQAVIAK